MSNTATLQPASHAVKRAYTREFLLSLYRTLYSIRTFETRCVKLYREGLIKGYFHPYLGEEAIATGVCAALKDQDYLVSTHRGHGHCIARGAELSRMTAEVLGKRTGYCKGLGGSMHIADATKGNLGANGIVAGGVAMGVGAALGATIRGEDSVCAIFFSDGATNNGVLPESLNMAAVWNAPVIFVLENNHYAVCTSVESSCKSKDLSSIAEGFAIESAIVDGNDVLAVYEQTMIAAEKCRQGKGPFFIEAKTYRHGGHHVNDPGTYMPQDVLQYYKSKDPIDVGRAHAQTIATISDDDMKALEASIEEEMEQAVTFAKESGELSADEFLKMIEGY